MQEHEDILNAKEDVGCWLLAVGFLAVSFWLLAFGLPSGQSVSARFLGYEKFQT
jgi:hypothetical protein